MLRSLPEAFEASELFSSLPFGINSRAAHPTDALFGGTPCRAPSPPPVYGETGAGGDMPNVPLQRWSPASAPSEPEQHLEDFATNN